MRKKEQSPMEKIAEAVANGDRETLTTFYRKRMRTYGQSGHGCYSPQVFETTMNAAKADPKKLQQDMLAEILAMLSMLAHRVREGILAGIKKHDDASNGSRPWGELPVSVADVLLPRYGKLAAEIRTTVKLMNSLESPPVSPREEAAVDG